MDLWPRAGDDRAWLLVGEAGLAFGVVPAGPATCCGVKPRPPRPGPGPPPEAPREAVARGPLTWGQVPARAASRANKDARNKAPGCSGTDLGYNSPCHQRVMLGVGLPAWQVAHAFV